jgi:hypothetical protein
LRSISAQTRIREVRANRPVKEQIAITAGQTKRPTKCAAWPIQVVGEDSRSESNDEMVEGND